MPIIMELPKLGVNMEKAKMVSWLAEEGDQITEGQALLEAETDKAVVEIPSTVTGILAKKIARVGQTINCGEPVAVFAAEGEDVAAAAKAAPAPTQPVSSEPTPPRAQSKKAPAPAPEKASQGRIRVSPRAKKMAKELDIDWRQVPPVKPGARITEADVEAFVKHRAAAPAAPAPVDQSLAVVDVIPLEGVRGVTAQRLAASARSTVRTILFMTVDMTKMLAWRQELKEDDLRVGFNALYVAIVAKALSEFPELNSRINNNRIELLGQINIGVAVDTARGLLVPVIREADRKGVVAIEQDFQDKVDRAKAGKSDMDDLSGGTFTITNLGMFGVDAFVPVINPPECAILAMGAMKKTPVAGDDDQISARPLVQLCLAWDHRITDGAPAARFLKRIKELIERPMGLMS